MPSSPDTEDSDRERAAVCQDKYEKQMSSSAGKGSTKRRTKTGCLTCRKRRIKCDEEKPFCKNCVKSKRECAGYVQPLVYKQHLYSAYPASHDGYDGHLVPHPATFSFNETIDPSLNHGRLPPNYFNPFGSYNYHPASYDREAPPLMPSSHQYASPATSQSHITTTPMSSDEENRRQAFSQGNSYLAYAGGDFSEPNRPASGWASSQYLPTSPQPAVSQHQDIISSASNLTSSYDTYPPVTERYFPSDATHLHGWYSSLNAMQTS